MKVFMIGDVISQCGCDCFKRVVPEFKRENNIDIVIVNGENSAVGNGILPSSANFLLNYGADIITTGNHAFKRREIYSCYDETPQVIRPANFSRSAPGNGYYIYDGGSFSLAVINLIGNVYMDAHENPFYKADETLNEIHADYIIVDFHAEATGEKKALGYYLDGRVSAVCGTHTHVQTADEQILPKGTAYITDLGMTGPVDSVLGVNPECIISRYLTNLPTRFEVAENSKTALNGVIIEFEKKKLLPVSIERVIL